MSVGAIEVRDLTKDFRTDFWKRPIRGLDGVSFSVPEGGVFGLIGHNGAGKTTAIKILVGLLRPTRGEARVFGCPVGETAFKRFVGYLPENAYYYDFLRAREILDFYGRLFGLSGKERAKKTAELLELVNLKEWANEKLRSFSKGMLQRIGIAQAIVNDPKLVILDEPMSGLDPIGRKEVRDIILRLGAGGRTIVFSSHILSDVEAICDQVAILVRGQLKASGSLADLVRARVKSVEVVFGRVGTPPWPKNLEGRVGVREAAGSHILSFEDVALLPSVLDWGRAQGLPLVSVLPQKETLEDLFLEKTGAAS